MPTPPRSLSRRQWFRRAGAGAAGLFLAPGLIERPSGAASLGHPIARRREDPVRLSVNENPYGPSESAREAMASAFGEACRYPYGAAQQELVDLIAAREGLSPEHVVLGCGSGELLSMAGLAAGLQGGGVVAAHPTFEGLQAYAEQVGAVVDRVPLNDEMAHDLDAMERRVKAGVRMVYVCNPNNPTGTLLDAARLRDFCRSVAPRATVLVDEAYIDLLGAPSEHTMAPLVREGLPVVVTRTFSKLHGLAGLRVGYALAPPDLVRRLASYRMGGPNVLGLRAATASLADEAFQAFSRTKIAEGRSAVYEVLGEIGYAYTPSQANFVFFRTGAPIADFRGAMLDRGVLVGRPFPPYLDWCRASIGTKEEIEVFLGALEETAEALDGSGR